MFGDEDVRTKSLTQTDEVDDYVAARPTGLFGNLVDVAPKDTLGSNFTLENQIKVDNDQMLFEIEEIDEIDSQATDEEADDAYNQDYT